MNPEFLFYIFFNALAAIMISPLFMSIIKKVKAYAQGRIGPSIFQTYYNIAKLLKKEIIYSTQSSYIMRISPYINFFAAVIATICVPIAFIPVQNYGLGNIILFLYILALAKVFMSLAGLDSASTFGGMGSSREMAVSAVFEPVIIIVFAGLAFTLHSFNIHELFFQSASSWQIFTNPVIFLSGISLFIILIVETARVPVDNPETHLELTMIHEAMILEQSGRNLALFELSHAIKQTLFMAFIINIILPLGLTTQLTMLSLTMALVAFIIKGVLLSVVIGIFESSMAKFRLFRLPGLFMIAFFFSFITIVFEVFFK